MPEPSVTTILDGRLKRHIYPRGFLATNTRRDIVTSLPVLHMWEKHEFGDYLVYCHPDTKCHSIESGDTILVLIGHCYNPWSGQAEEKHVLRELGKCLPSERDKFLEVLDEISGRFVLFCVSGGSIEVYHDCAGIQSVYYHKNKEEIFIASHSGLIADINGLEVSQQIRSLTSSRFYSIGIRHLPGIKSPFEGVYLLTANTCLTADSDRLQVRRYFPREPLESVTLEDAVPVIGDVLVNSVRLLVDKANIAVSLTGGLDSRVTLGATRDVAHRIWYFSYSSTPAEERDAQMAEQLCQALGLTHMIYRIPEKLDSEADHALIEIMEHNTSGIRNPNEYSKSIYLMRTMPSNTLEIKSTVSEIGRKFYCKKLGVPYMPNQLTPRMMSNLYKRNAFNRRILRYMDEAFEEFINVTGFGQNFMNYEQDDMFYWEHRLSAWQSLVVHDSDYSRDTTMLFNNRKLQKVFLSVDVKHRLDDDLQYRIARHLWPEAAALPLTTNTGSRSLNARLREAAERWFFRLNRF